MSSATFKHLFLTRGADQEEARHKVLHFLEHTELIRYEAMTTHDQAIMSAANPTFWTTMEEAIASNRDVAKGLLAELEETGISRLAELKDLPQGYPSKVLHTLVHILDGFIGVDSAFYNLLEDSHWLSDKLRRTISDDPAEYWLIPVVPGRLKYSVFHPQRD